MMKFVDVENWKRKDHYNYFRQLAYPHFNICGNIDITKLHGYVKGNGLPFFVSVLYLSAKTANSIREFRLRIRKDRVVEHETVDPSFTVMTAGEVFGFCTVRFVDRFGDFKAGTQREIRNAQKNASIEDEPGRDDLLFITSIPWVSFTGITHPIQMNPVDSIPRISWGKYFDENGKIKLPLSVQVHHALMDGTHVGQYFNMLQEIADNPAEYLV